MEVSIVGRAGIADEAIFSVRAGPVKRQAPANANKPFRFPRDPKAEQDSLLKFDLLTRVGTGYIVLKPFDAKYKVAFGADVNAEVEVKWAKGNEMNEPLPVEEVKVDKQAGAKEAQDYLEKHGVLHFVQAMIQAVIKERPADPFAYMGRQFLHGYDSVQPGLQTRTQAAPAQAVEQKSSPPPAAAEAVEQKSSPPPAAAEAAAQKASPPPPAAEASPADLPAAAESKHMPPPPVAKKAGSEVGPDISSLKHCPVAEASEAAKRASLTRRPSAPPVVTDAMLQGLAPKAALAPAAASSQQQPQQTASAAASSQQQQPAQPAASEAERLCSRLKAVLEGACLDGELDSTLAVMASGLTSEGFQVLPAGAIPMEPVRRTSGSSLGGSEAGKQVDQGQAGPAQPAAGQAAPEAAPPFSCCAGAFFRAKAKQLLGNSVQDGSLLGALSKVKVKKEDSTASCSSGQQVVDISAVRKKARDTLEEGLKDGTLAGSLTQVAKSARQDLDLDSVRMRVCAVLEGGQLDGTLAKELRAEASATEKKPPPGVSAEDAAAAAKKIQAVQKGRADRQRVEGLKVETKKQA